MFISSVGALNSVNRKQWVHQPRKWPKKDEDLPEPVKDETIGPGVRRAGEPTIGKPKDIDPLEELRKEILGK